MRAELEELMGAVVAASGRGDFTLSSGLKSDFYFDGRLVTMSPRYCLLIADELERFIAGLRDANTPTALGGPAVAAIPIVSATATLMRYRLGAGSPIKNTFFMRSEAKGHGTKKLIEGMVLTKIDRVVVVDDTLTTGGSLLKTIAEVRATGASVIAAWVLLDREEGGRKALMDADVPFIHALFAKKAVFAAMDKATARNAPEAVTTPVNTLETIQGASCPRCNMRPVTREVLTRRGDLVAVWRCVSSTGKTESCGELAETAVDASFVAVRRAHRPARPTEAGGA